MADCGEKIWKEKEKRKTEWDLYLKKLNYSLLNDCLVVL